MRKIQQVIEDLRDMAAPLSPFETLESRYAQREKWHAAAADGTFEELLHLLCEPVDPARYAPVTTDDFRMEIIEALESIGKRDPAKYIELVKANIHNINARAALIEVIGGLGQQEGVPLLAALLEKENLDAQEKIDLACALGEIGGNQARIVLQKMRSSLLKGDDELAEEIDIALGDI